jgi:hypothetical protein
MRGEKEPVVLRMISQVHHAFSAEAYQRERGTRRTRQPIKAVKSEFGLNTKGLKPGVGAGFSTLQHAGEFE